MECVWVKGNLIVSKSEGTNEKHIVYNLWAYNLKTRSGDFTASVIISPRAAKNNNTIVLYDIEAMCVKSKMVSQSWNFLAWDQYPSGYKKPAGTKNDTTSVCSSYLWQNAITFSSIVVHFVSWGLELIVSGLKVKVF